MVPPRFQQLRDRTVALNDQMWAEEIRLSPMSGAQPDPQRPQMIIEAPLRTGVSKGSSIEGGQGRSWRTRLQAGTAELHIDRTRYPDLVIRKGDAVRAISREGQPAYEVLSVDPRNHVRLIVSLGEK